MTAKAKTAMDFNAFLLENLGYWEQFGSAEKQRRVDVDVEWRLLAWSYLAGDCMRGNCSLPGDACKLCRYAHHTGPDSEAKRQYRARECIVQAICGALGKTHLAQQRGPESSLEQRRRLGCKIGRSGTTCSMQRDGYTIARERRNNGCLVANAVEPVLRCAAEITYGI